jgi:hypothetical protein
MRRSTAHRFAESTLREYARRDALTPESLSPRVKLALRLYVHGVVPTQKAAAEAAGLHPMSFHTVLHTAAGQAYMKTAHELIEQHAHDTNALIQGLSVRAIQVLGTLMEDAGKEDVRLRAAVDLADRGTETAKIHKHQVESFTLAGADARALAESVVMAATVRNQNANLRVENFDRVNVDEVDTPDEVVPPHPQLLLLPD